MHPANRMGPTKPDQPLGCAPATSGLDAHGNPGAGAACGCSRGHDATVHGRPVFHPADDALVFIAGVIDEPQEQEADHLRGAHLIGLNLGHLRRQLAQQLAVQHPVFLVTRIARRPHHAFLATEMVVGVFVELDQFARDDQAPRPLRVQIRQFVDEHDETLVLPVNLRQSGIVAGMPGDLIHSDVHINTVVTTEL
jgi:hypothetical protein